MSTSALAGAPRHSQHIRRGCAQAVCLVAMLVMCLTSAGCAAESSPHHRTAATVGPTFLGNSFSAGVAGSVPHSIMALGVSQDGVAVSGSTWEEYNHDARLFAPRTGAVLGPFTRTRDTGGIYAVAIDRRYVYATSGLSVLRFNRSEWLDPRNVTWSDDGMNTGVRPLAVDTNGDGWLMGLAVCSSRLFVSDPGGGRRLGRNGLISPESAEVKTIPLDLSRVTSTWSVPHARSITCDRQGDIWVLQQGAPGGPSPRAARFTPSGRPLGSFRLPGSPTGIAADPTRNSIVVADNGRDQNFKRFDYRGRLIGTIGVTGGYLAAPHPGLVAPGRFVGPRAVAIDGAGDVYTAESGLPGVGARAWVDMGSMAIITKFRRNGRAVVWRDYGLAFADVGEPSSDGTRFYDRHWEFIRSARGRYRPYAFTVDPFRYPSDERVGHGGDEYGASTRVIDLHGRRYLTMSDTPLHQFEIYVMHGNIAQPVVWFDGNAKIHTNGTTVTVASNPRLPDNNGAEDWWMDAHGNVWSAGGLDGIWRYRLRGIDRNGTPRYDFNHLDVYPFPPQLRGGARRIEVFGQTIYVSGFSASDPDPGNDWDGWKSIGRHLLRFSALPTAAGWPAPTWETNFSYGSGPGQKSYPTTVAADPAAGHVAVGWLYSPATNQGRIDVLSDSNASTLLTLDPPAPSLGTVGWLDMKQSIEAGNGWLWVEDDWQSKIYGLCVSGQCS